MVNPSSTEKFRVMLDANVLIAGTIWPRWQYAILQHALLGDFQLVLAPLIIEAARRHILEIEPKQLPRFERFLAGTELANYTGREPKVFQPGSWCAYPWRSGYANVGIVRAIGDNVSRAKPGARVFTYGNHASAIRYNGGRLVVRAPQSIDSPIAAASRMAGVGTTAVIVGEIQNAPWVLIFGLGMVGNMAAQAFRIRGCRVIGVDPVEARRKLAEQCGIPCTIGGFYEPVENNLISIISKEIL